MPDTNTVRWQPNREVSAPAWPTPPLLTALARGAMGRCPACGQAKLFAGWLRVAQTCPACSAPLGEVRADDAPPYFTIFIVAHVIVGAQLLLESRTDLSVLTEMLILLPATLGLCVALIRPVKGATVGLMLKLGMTKPPGEA